MMGRPAFFDEAGLILIRDSLADLPGAAEGGLLEYRYVDAVCLAGRSGGHPKTNFANCRKISMHRMPPGVEHVVS
jgi:hypothetical protein